MATPGAERVVLDTSVLLAATDEARSEHRAALESLNDWPRAGVALYTSGQILREYLTVATRPAAGNGLAMTTADAVANVRVLQQRLHLLAEDGRVANRLLDVLDHVDCAGQQIHDANVVATMLVHGIATLVTANVADFARYGDRIEVLAL